jgi:hypothetical protein
MNQYRTSAWFAAAVSIILILKGLITSVSSTELDVPTLIIANILPIILLYVSICLMKAIDKKASATTASVLISIAGVLWLISLIPGFPIIIAAFIIVINFLISIAALIVINWYVGKTAGIAITLVILLIIFVFVGAYGASLFSSQPSGTTINQLQ